MERSAVVQNPAKSPAAGAFTLECLHPIAEEELPNQIDFRTNLRES
jgi:hypothetical protein